MGFYPVMPGTRFPYDVDGTVVLRTRENNIWYEWSDVHKRIILAEDTRMVSFPSLIMDKTKVAFVFPEPRDITAAFIVASWSTGTSANHTQVGVTYPITCEYSSDTTNGSDGTWNTTSFVNANPLSSDYTPLAASFYPQLGINEDPPTNFSAYLANPILPYYRSRAKVPQDPIIGASGIRLWMGPGGVVPSVSGNGIRFGVQLIHLYGSYTASPRNKLVFWHPTLDRPLTGADTDLDDTQIATNYLKQFRLKNLSSSRDALGVSIYPENSSAYLELSDFIDFYYQSVYTRSVILPAILKNGLSPAMGARFRIPYRAQMSTWPARIGFSVGEWS